LTSSGNTINKSSRPANGEYRYQDNNIQTKPATDDIQRQIEDEKQRKKEAEDRIKQLEKQKTEEQKSNTNNPESIDDKEDDVAMSSPSPVFSLMKSFF
jgi:predicted  nucleic acid-binding Zn-ribbon protein